MFDPAAFGEPFSLAEFLPLPVQDILTSTDCAFDAAFDSAFDICESAPEIASGGFGGRVRLFTIPEAIEDPDELLALI